MRIMKMGKKLSWPQQGHRKGMDKYNKYFITDKLQITATTDNCNDKNDDNLHSKHDFAPV